MFDARARRIEFLPDIIKKSDGKSDIQTKRNDVQMVVGGSYRGVGRYHQIVYGLHLQWKYLIADASTTLSDVWVFHIAAGVVDDDVTLTTTAIF